MRQKTARTKAVADAEKTQVRARKVVGHEFALTRDSKGRERLVTGTAESKRRYEVGSGGRTVRVRNTDPLAAISSLTPGQRRAGEAFRDDFEASIVRIHGVFLEERVDGGSTGGGLPAALLGRGQSFEAARRAVGHDDIASVVDGICILGRSVKAIADEVGESRDVVAKLLKIGLDNLAAHYASKRGRSLR